MNTPEIHQPWPQPGDTSTINDAPTAPVTPGCGLSRRQRRKVHQINICNTSKATQSKRRKLWDETNGRCCYCDQEPSDKDRTMDHLWPKSKGGTLAISNLIPACHQCNVGRAAKFPASPHVHERWKSYVRKKEAAQGFHHTP